MFAQLTPDSKSIPASNGVSEGILNTREEINIFYWQDFDSGLMPPSAWNLISGNTPQTWQAGTSDIYPPVSGDYFALCRYDATYVPEGQDEKLFTPVMNLNGLDDAKLSFWFLFSRYWGITPYDNYDLQVLLSTDGGVTFPDTIWTELSSDTASWTSWQWVRGDVDLSAYTGQSAIQLCFRYVGYDGADAAIDNVEISFITGMNEMLTESIILYPNPAQDVLYLNGNGQRIVEVYDLTGKLLINETVQSYNPSVNLGHLSPGIYSVVVMDIQRQPVYSGKIAISK